MSTTNPSPGLRRADPAQRLKETGPGLELWWDSSPLVYREWAGGLDDSYQDVELFQVENGRDGLQFSASSLLQGSTTNQPLTWQVIEKEPEFWGQWIAANSRDLDRSDPSVPSGCASSKEAMWRLFIEIARRGAEMLGPIHAASGGKLGQICCQVDPRDMTDREAMLAQARRIHAARSNIMVKMPGTQEGIEGVRILTAEGIPTNVTLGFTVPQLVAVGEAARAGLAEAQARGTDLSNWRSCAVMMLGRYEDAPPMKAQAAALGIELSEADLRWAGVAIFRKAHKLFRERGYPSKLMAASMRPGPVIAGVKHVWHLEKLAGADAVLTVFPNIFELLLSSYAGLPLEPQIDEPLPEDVLERLLRIPYFAEAYDEDGIAPADWARHPALRATADSFSEAMAKVEAFAASKIA